MVKNFSYTSPREALAGDMNRLFNFAERTRIAARRWTLAEIGGIATVAGGVFLVITGEPAEGVIMGGLGGLITWESDRQRRGHTVAADADQNEAEEIHAAVYNDFGDHQPVPARSKLVIRPISTPGGEAHAV
jgi:hypothetical protein